MGWDRSKPTAAKYKTPEHRRERRKYADQMKRDGHLICAQPRCLMTSRVIVPGEPWHLGHDDTGTAYLGPVHKQCNVTDGAVRGRAKQNTSPTRWEL